MDSVNLNKLLDILKDIEKKKSNLQDYFSKLTQSSREELLLDIYEKILDNNLLLEEARKGGEKLCHDKASSKQGTTVERIITDVQNNPSKKVFFLKEFLDKFQDISEADKHSDRKEYFFGSIDRNRIGFSIGRDIILSPEQISAPLNYFIYPYAEVDGENHEKISREIYFKDISS